MHVIVFASQKGGSGKTTLCGQLAIQAERAGAGPVALIDTDPQGSLAEWWNARSESTPAFVKTRFTELMDDLAHLNNAGMELVFIDTPPAVTDAIRAVVTFADIVVIPTRPSPHDLRAVGATVDIVEYLGKPLVFAVNAATPRARITAKSAIALSQHGTVAPVTVHQRTDFATSMIDGRSVMELNPDSRSSQEMVGLWNYISTRLGKVERRAEPQPYEGEERRYPVRDLPDSRQLFGNQSARPGFGRRPWPPLFGQPAGQ
jgi:chromosome partitioning protein